MSENSFSDDGLAVQIQLGYIPLNQNKSRISDIFISDTYA